MRVLQRPRHPRVARSDHRAEAPAAERRTGLERRVARRARQGPRLGEGLPRRRAVAGAAGRVAERHEHLRPPRVAVRQGGEARPRCAAASSSASRARARAAAAVNHRIASSGSASGRAGLQVAGGVGGDAASGSRSARGTTTSAMRRWRRRRMGGESRSASASATRACPNAWRSRGGVGLGHQPRLPRPLDGRERRRSVQLLQQVEGELRPDQRGGLQGRDHVGAEAVNALADQLDDALRDGGPLVAARRRGPRTSSPSSSGLPRARRPSPAASATAAPCDPTRSATSAASRPANGTDTSGWSRRRSERAAARGCVRGDLGVAIGAEHQQGRSVESSGSGGAASGGRRGRSSGGRRAPAASAGARRSPPAPRGRPRRRGTGPCPRRRTRPPPGRARPPAARRARSTRRRPISSSRSAAGQARRRCRSRASTNGWWGTGASSSERP